MFSPGNREDAGPQTSKTEAISNTILAPGATKEDEFDDSNSQRWLQRKSVAVTLAAVLLFFTGLPLELVALGAAAVILLSRTKPEKVYLEVDWSLLVMFTGLFIVVHAFQVHVVSQWGIEGWTWVLTRPVDLMSLVSAGLSNLVSNVPAGVKNGTTIETDLVRFLELAPVVALPELRRWPGLVPFEADGLETLHVAESIQDLGDIPQGQADILQRQLKMVSLQDRSFPFSVAATIMPAAGIRFVEPGDFLHLCRLMNLFTPAGMSLFDPRDSPIDNGANQSPRSIHWLVVFPDGPNLEHGEGKPPPFPDEYPGRRTAVGFPLRCTGLHFYQRRGSEKRETCNEVTSGNGERCGLVR